MSTPLASVFVEGRIDMSKAPEDIRRGLSSGAVSSSAASAGKKTGAEFGSKFSTGVVETGRKGTTTLFEQAEKGAVTSGLGIGRRAGLSITKGLGEYAKVAGATVAGFFAAEKVKEFFSDVFTEGEKSQQTLQLLQAHLVSTGGAAGVTAEHVEALAASQEKLTGIDEDSIQTAATLELTFANIRNEMGKGNDVYDRTLVMAENLSAAMGIGLTQSLRLVGRAVNDPIHGLSSLSRTGVQFTIQQQEQIKTLEESGHILQAQGVILDALGVKFAGSAQAADTPVKQLKADFETFEQNLGLKLIPLVNDGATGLVSLASGAETLAHLIGEVPGPVRDVALAMLVFKAASAIGIFDSIASGWTMLRVKASETGDAIKGADTKMAALRGGAALLGVGLGELSAHTTGTVHDLTAIASSAALGEAAFPGWGAAIGAGIGLVTVLGSKSHISAADVDELTSSLNKQTGALTGNSLTQIYQALKDNGAPDIVRELGLSITQVTDAATGQRQPLQALTDQYDAMVARGRELITLSTGEISTYAAAHPEYQQRIRDFQQLLDIVYAQNGSVADARQEWGDLNSILGQNKGQTDGAAGSVKSLADQVSDLNRQLDNELSRILKLNGTNLGLRGDYRAVQQAIDDATAALKQNGVTLDINTEKGRNNQAALDSIASSMGQTASDLATRFGEGSKQEITYLETARHSLERQAVQFGLTKAEAWRYVNTVLGIPKDAKTLLSIDRGDSAQKILKQHDDLQHLQSFLPITTIGVDTKQAVSDMQSFGGAALTQLRGVNDFVPKVTVDTSDAISGLSRFRETAEGMLDSIPDEPVNITLTAQANKVFNELGGIPMATGGPVSGGTPGKDSVHILGMPGEHMLTVDDVAAMGGQSGVHAFRRALHMANGGPVVDLHAPSRGLAGAVGSVSAGFDTIAGKIGDSLSSAISKKVSAYQPPVGGGSTAMSGAAWPAIAQAARLYSWGSGPEWEALVKVVNRESGGNPLAQNPTSTAFGIGQFLDGTWASVGGYKTTDAYLQSIFMDRYISQRYGDPIGAWAHEVSAGWYDDHGGPLPPGPNLVLNGTNDVHQVVHGDDMGDLVTINRAILAALEQHGIKVKAMPDLGSQIESRAQGVYDANTNWRQR